MRGAPQPWVGVDPGARWTGVVGRIGSRPVWHAVLDGDDGPPWPDPARFEAIRDAVLVARDELLAVAPGPRVVMVGIEDVGTPNPHLGTINPENVIRLGVVVGWLRATFPKHVMVPPGGHGSRPLATYPAELVTAQERAHALRARTLREPAPQNSRARHARSAWDVAGAAALQSRIAAATPAPRAQPAAPGRAVRTSKRRS